MNTQGICALVFLFSIEVRSQAKFLNMIQFTTQMRNDFVDDHNQIRAGVSPTAADMRKLSWDNEMEQKAQAFVRKCVFEHSSVPIISSQFGELGENLWMGTGRQDADIPSEATGSWLEEAAYYNINGDPTCQYGEICGHYTQQIWANTQKIGCAASRCSSPGWENAAMVLCLYGPAGNDYSYYGDELPPYTIGTSCSKCPSGASSCSNNLCV